MTLTEYGFCISDISHQMEAGEDGHIHGTEKSNNVLDITLAYNITDWTAGYFGEIGGYIAYFRESSSICTSSMGQDGRPIHINILTYRT